MSFIFSGLFGSYLFTTQNFYYINFAKPLDNRSIIWYHIYVANVFIAFAASIRRDVRAV